MIAVNGLQLPIIDGSLRVLAPEEIGSGGRSGAGTHRSARRKLKNGIGFTTPPLSAADAEFWRGILLGHAERWNFEADYFGSKGTHPISAANLGNGGSGYFGDGDGRLLFDANGASFAVPVLAGGDRWSISFRSLVGPSAGLWNFVRLSLSPIVAYKNGSLVTTPVGWVSWDGSTGITITRNDATGGVTEISDLAIFNFALPVGVIGEIAGLDLQMSNFPTLRLHGDEVARFFGRYFVNAFGVVDDTSARSATPNPRFSVTASLLEK